MSIIDFLLLLLIAGVCGALAQSLSGYSRGGCLISIVLGFVGALFGRFLSNAFGLPELIPIYVGDQSFPIIWSIIGGALFSAALGLISRRRVL